MTSHILILCEQILNSILHINEISYKYIYDLLINKDNNELVTQMEN